LSTAPGPALFKRLTEHKVSIVATENLKIGDFLCRYLVSDDIWIPLGESLLIESFQPLWNVLIEGFGIHTPGAGRKKQVRSKWDTLHPGRTLAADLPLNPKTNTELERMIDDFFAGKSVPIISPERAVTEEGEN
jgi:Eco29kI-like restriction endonuclease